MRPTPAHPLPVAVPPSAQPWDWSRSAVSTYEFGVGWAQGTSGTSREQPLPRVPKRAHSAVSTCTPRTFEVAKSRGSKRSETMRAVGAIGQPLPLEPRLTYPGVAEVRQTQGECQLSHAERVVGLTQR
jgi:hypothetical protein